MPIVRPGSKTANPIMHRQSLQANAAPDRRGKWWKQRVRVVSDFSDADQSQSLDLNAAFPDNPFPPNAIILVGTMVDLVQVVAGGGITTATMILGDTDDDNGLLTSTDIFTGATLGLKSTRAAAEYAWGELHAQYVPLLQIDVGVGTLAGATSGILDVWIPYTLAPNHATTL